MKAINVDSKENVSIYQGLSMFMAAMHGNIASVIPNVPGAFAHDSQLVKVLLVIGRLTCTVCFVKQGHGASAT